MTILRKQKTGNFTTVNNYFINDPNLKPDGKGFLLFMLSKPDDWKFNFINFQKSLGIDKIKCIIKNLSDNEATIFMVDSNLQREKLLPSEKAFAYKMKYEALKHQRKDTVNQPDTEVCQVGTVVRSDNILSDELGESAPGKTIRASIEK